MFNEIGRHTLTILSKRVIRRLILDVEGHRDLFRIRVEGKERYVRGLDWTCKETTYWEKEACDERPGMSVTWDWELKRREVFREVHNASRENNLDFFFL